MKLEVLADKFGFSMEQGIPTGNMSGYPFFIVNYQVDTFVKTPMFMFVFERKITKMEKVEIQKVSKLMMIRYESVALEDNTVVVPFRFGFKPSEKHDRYFEKLTNTFKALNLSPLHHCPICGKEDTDVTRIIQGCIVKVHSNCVQDFKKNFSVQIEKLEQSRDHLGKSLIYAFLGALIGAIPTLISIFAFQYMFAVLYALIPLASFYGYKRGGAVRKNFVPFAVTLISVMIVFLMDYMLYVLIAAAENVTFSEAMNIPDFSSSFMKDLLMSMAFLFIGVAISWRQMKKQTTGEINKRFEGLK